MSSEFALSGVYSGIDTTVLVDAGVAVASIPLERFRSDKVLWQQKISDLAEIETTLGQMKTLAEEMSDVDNLRGATASVGDSDILSVTASTGVTPGTHEIIVNRLASGEKEVHDGLTPTETWTHRLAVATADTEYFNADLISPDTGEDYKFVFKFGDEAQVEVDLSSYDLTGITLNQLVSAINTAAGYTAASAFEDDAGYKLRIQAQAAGDDTDLVITDDNSVGNLDETDDFVQTTAGDDNEGALVGAGNFVYTCDGVTRTITTTATTTLGGLRDLINNDGQNPGIAASILDYEGDPDERYHLVLQGKDTGGDYAITIEAATTLAGFASTDWTQTQTAQDSQIRVDGYPAADWIERSSNSISNVIPGVTLGLTSTGTTNISLLRDTGGLSQDLENMIEIYNRIANLIDEDVSYDEETQTSGIFKGDIVVRGFMTTVRSILTRSPDGFDSSADGYTLPGQIGVQIDRYGVMSLDSSIFDEAISDDYNAVLSLVGAMGTGFTDSAFVQYNSAGMSTIAGAYDLKVDFDTDDEITGAWFRDAGSEEDWREGSWSGLIVHGGTEYDETGLSVTLTVDPAHSGQGYTQLAQVNVRHGLATRLYQELEGMLDSFDGTVTLKKKQYVAKTEYLDKQIVREEARVERQRKYLTAKYARMEQALAQLDYVRSSVTAMTMQLQSLNAASSEWGNS